MKKPPCPKCHGKNTYLEVPRFNPDQLFLGCYTCGWRLYGEPGIRGFVDAYNENLLAAEREKIEAIERQKHEEALERRRIRDRKNRERKRLAAEEAKKKAEQKIKKPTKKVHIIPAIGVQFEVGQMDPVLQVVWAQPEPNKDGESLNPCAWPPCTKRARAKSKYCSRTCTVRVAHRRDKLRKQGKLADKKAS